ncbi:hypothetical protein OVS_01490 [Mycoplasma ovis str. Michigan]|uniref:Uncharacterized protein n=1 Tax=Mycoplasma ovis str. Michigan TaxID=1415773 RepID=A0ABM5P1S0_9MOLU|nr:hypothetical protein [Mycoplasma ovis]AHC40205.1 hypothetical protein OVS_01490 [Mycoplasma ovis str. Michigan]
MTEEEFNEKDGFFLKNSLDVLNVKDCQMVTTQPSGNWNSIKCLEKEYSLTDNNQVFF